MRSSFKHCVLIAGLTLASVACKESSGDAGSFAGAGSGAGVGVAGSGAAGSGDAGSTSGVASATASATLTPLGGAGLSGSATFTKLTYGIKLAVSVTNCSDGKSYPIHIHDGSSCADAASQGGHWGAPPAVAANGGNTLSSTSVLRGEGIPDIVCSGNTGATMHTRSTPDIRAAWTVDTNPATDVVGHVLVVHDGITGVACGRIVAP